MSAISRFRPVMLVLATLALAAPAAIRAETCLLDVNGDGVVHASDGDLSASSSPNDGNAGASDDDNLACGAYAAARGDASTAIGFSAQAGYFDATLQLATGSATAVGANATAQGNFGTALGFGARAGNYVVGTALPEAALALGYSAVSTHDRAAAIGAEARATARNALAVGAMALAGGSESIAMGSTAQAAGERALAIGPNSRASGREAIAIGADSISTGIRGLAVGKTAFASGEEANAFGFQAGASGYKSTAVGSSARATAEKSTAMGERSVSGGYGSVALGHDAIVTPPAAYGIAMGAFTRTTARQAMAIGYRASASQENALAIGAEAVADRLNATAIGFRANTSANNQLMLGGPGSAVALGDIVASNAAQVGAEQVVTIDASGTLGVSNLASAAALGDVRNTMAQLAASSGAQMDSLTDRISLLDSHLAGFDLRMRGMEGGIAAAMAMGSAVPLPGHGLTLTVAGATVGGEQALAGMLGGWLSQSVFVSGAVSSNTGDRRVGARVAASFGF